MRGLEAPPKTEKPSRIAARFLTLIIFATGAGIAIFTAVTNQTVDVAEDIRPVNLELGETTVIDGFRTNIRVDEGGPSPVLTIHDVDASGGLILDDLSDALPDTHHGVRLDLPGFGFSTRMPVEGPHHTVAGMAERLAPVLQERFSDPVRIIGIGFGGEVGAELAYSYPDLVAGLVMVDVDFWSSLPFPQSIERLSWIGKAATYTWETGGRFALDNWAPYCAEGGWCPTAGEASLREVIIEVERTTDSLHAFRSTPEAALAPASLDQITVPMAYVWSTDGAVSQSTIDRLTEEIGRVDIVESSSFQAHLEDPATVAAALEDLGG